MVRIKIKGKTPVRSPTNGSRKGAKVQQPEPAPKPIQKEKGILQRMLEIISDDIHGKERKVMEDTEESWIDWKGQL